jgi:hypothetical protein
MQWLQRAIDLDPSFAAAYAFLSQVTIEAALSDGRWRRQQELERHIALRPALGATKGLRE